MGIFIQMEGQHMITINAKFDSPIVPLGQGSRLRLLVSLNGEAASGRIRPRLNLGLVLDHSGSMQGAKVDHVKAATKGLVRRLGADDLISLTIFDHEVSPLVLPVRVAGIHGFDALVDRIEARGQTNLSGGYEQGFQFTQRNAATGAISRIILLTDGLANQGITDRHKLTRIARTYHEAGVSTTTIGVGSDYDEELLGAIAESGTGGVYHIASPDDAPSIFQEELGYLLELVASEVSIGIHFQTPATQAEQLNTYRVLDGRRYEIGDLYGGQARSLVLEITVPARQETGVLDLGILDLRYRDLADERMPWREERMALKVEVVSAERFATVEPDREVTVEAVLLQLARAKKEVLTLADEGRFEDAAARAMDAAEEARRLKLMEPRVDREIADLLDVAGQIRLHGRAYYTRDRRKEMYFRSSYAMNSKLAQLNEMMRRKR